MSPMSRIMPQRFSGIYGLLQGPQNSHGLFQREAEPVYCAASRRTFALKTVLDLYVCKPNSLGASLKQVLKGNTRMNNLDSILERNKDFAAQQSAADTLMPSLPQAMPNVKATIIGCADMRADPVHVLGIKTGEAVVIRNIGVGSSRGCWSS
jgi:hypothetical protein